MSGSLYGQLLGADAARLPAAVLAMHDGIAAASGEASVERGGGLLARLAAWMVGFPKATQCVPLRMTFERRGEAELWTRDFGGAGFQSLLSVGAGRNQGLLVEKVGPLSFAMALVAGDGALQLKMRRWAAFGLPLPLALAPRSQAVESAEGGIFRFHVELSHPLTGLIVRYRGWLRPE